MSAPAAKVHPMIVQQIANAGIRAVQIEAIAAHLASLMKEVHGGDWRVQVDHECHFIIAAKPS